MKTGMLRPIRAIRAYCRGLALALIAAAPSIGLADSKCRVGQLAEFPIRIEGGRAILTAGINGVDAGFTLDSGAFYSFLSSAAASQFKLDTHPAPFGLYVTGVHGGTSELSLATVKTLTLTGVPVKNVEFLVGGSDPQAGTVGLLGQNLLHIADDEYDLRQGVMRLMKPLDCSKAALAYWAAGTAQPYSTISIDQGVKPNWHTIGSAFLNGAKIRVQFDSGAPASVLSTRAAARAGIRPDSPGVTHVGQSYGIGRATYAAYIAPFASFKIGDEEIKNAKLQMGDIELQDADMLLGLDFFLSHRIYVANSQNKLYFTYDGGPVFDLKTRRPTGGESSAAAVPASNGPSGDEAPHPAGTADEAADLNRQGAAAAARGQLDEAIADFNRACEIVPDNPEYLFQRGMALWRNKQPDLAQADFDRAIQLAPSDTPVRVARAELSLTRHDQAGAAADLDAADAAAATQADLRFTMAGLYWRADLLDRSLKQFDSWIEFHDADARMPAALDGRCRIRALLGTQLPQALKDCNTARGRVDKSNPLLARILDSRGLVFLRMNDYDKSMADYDASIKLAPKSAGAWYGRGIVELRLNKAAAGNTDIEHAKTLAPKVADVFSRYGITP
jgi:tetratricopeptide (TPR) repeat protein